MPTYAGNDTFPELVTIPADGPLLAAATLNVPNEANLDRTRWLFRREQMRAVHFDPMTEHTLAHATHRDGRPAYSLRRQRWYIGGGDAKISRTEDYGATWVSDLTTGPGSTTGYHGAFINDPGNARYGNGLFVAAKTETWYASYAYAGNVWTAGLALPSATWGGIIHEPIADNWVIWDVGKLWTSPTAAIAWTDRSALPGGGSPGLIPIASNGAGLLMLHGKLKGVYTSSDGGVTWVECTTAFGLLVITSIVWDAWRGRFVVALTDGAGLAETWWSTDGGTWFMLATGIQFGEPTTPAGYIFELQSLGPVLVGTLLSQVGGQIRTVYSVDGGTTWGRGPCPVWANNTALVYLANNGSDILAVNLNTNYKGVSFVRGCVPIGSF